MRVCKNCNAFKTFLTFIEMPELDYPKTWDERKKHMKWHPYELCLNFLFKIASMVTLMVAKMLSLYGGKWEQYGFIAVGVCCFKTQLAHLTKFWENCLFCKAVTSINCFCIQSVDIVCSRSSKGLKSKYLGSGQELKG